MLTRVPWPGGNGGGDGGGALRASAAVSAAVVSCTGGFGSLGATGFKTGAALALVILLIVTILVCGSSG
jgi:hypothetical protein